MAEIKPLLGIQLDLTRPVDELVSVINAVLDNHPQREREILIELDSRIGDFLAKQLKQELPEEGGGEVEQSGNGDPDEDKQSDRKA
ncbi:hypothetical protein NYE69_26985 [Paenibacillus sp. FSL R5-0527]|uniref:hypothetical protein n=1 Tax=Paenibacillus sp. FSL R5-0527 TaxID=2975321 RepID=UPI00097B0DBF|nr:hypothetical protein BK140_22500 [Paenibacillus macerans]